MTSPKSENPKESADEAVRSVRDFDTTQSLRKALENARMGENCESCLASPSMPREDLDDIKSDWVVSNPDPKIALPQTVEQEMLRLQELMKYNILDSAPEAAFERLTALAGRVFDVPICTISLIDIGRVWFMSQRGLGDCREITRRVSFCSHVIISSENLLVVPDLTADSRFVDNPLVTGEPKLRFYIGAPLISPGGYKIGSLCMADTKARPEGLTLAQKQNYLGFADLVVDAMVERYQKKARKEQDKSSILACTAHDLLTQLNGVELSLNLLLEDDALKRHLSHNQKELIATAGSCSETMKNICGQAMHQFRKNITARNGTTMANDENQEPGIRRIVVADLAQKLHWTAKNCTKSVVPIRISVDPGVPPIILSDYLVLFRGAVNFLTNAARKTEKGSVLLKIYIEASENGKEMIFFECDDTGPGVPVDIRPRLFQPFPSEENDSNQISRSVSAGSGAGLGLYSVSTSISSMGGSCGFKPKGENNDDNSNESTGSIFWFSVPVVLPERYDEHTHITQINGVVERENTDMLRSASDIALSAQLAQKVQDLCSVTVDEEKGTNIEHKAISNGTASPTLVTRARSALVIDDSTVIRKTLDRALSNLGFQVSQAVNGLDGLDMLKTSLFDVVFCDFLMPVMDGFDCVQQYREWEKNNKPFSSLKQLIIGISAHANRNDAEKGLSVGMDSFRTKPITLKMLKEITTEKFFLDRKEALDASVQNNVNSTNTVQKKSGGVIDDNFFFSASTNNCENQKNSNECNSSVSDSSSKNDELACLIAEDSPSVCKVMKMAVEREGWKVSVVHNGEDALRLLKTRKWDAVFLDDDMPLLTGIKCIEVFREWENEYRVSRQNNVSLISGNYSALPNTAGTIVSYPNGFDGAIEKPLRVNDIKALLSAAVESKSKTHDIVLR